MRSRSRPLCFFNAFLLSTYTLHVLYTLTVFLHAFPYVLVIFYLTQGVAGGVPTIFRGENAMTILFDPV